MQAQGGNHQATPAAAAFKQLRHGAEQRAGIHFRDDGFHSPGKQDGPLTGHGMPLPAAETFRGERAEQRMLRQFLSSNLKGKRVLDVGCGTGILGIGAMLAGASHLTAVDIDNSSVENTIDNLRLNGIEGSEVKEGGFSAFTQLLVLISINLGLMNLLPIPGLDGSRLVFGIVEVIRRKPVPPEKEAVVHLVGMVLLFGLMIFFTMKDIMRLFG